jgi:hypothetical protein
MNGSEQTQQLLSAMLEELRMMNHPSSLGFVDLPRPRYIYANRKHNGTLWYFWDGDNHEPIMSTGLAARIVRLEIKAREYKGKEGEKLNIHVQADRPYIIQSGLDTVYATGMLKMLGTLTPEELRGVLTIGFEGGDNESVLLPRLYVADRSIYGGDAPDPASWAELVNWLNERLGVKESAPDSEPRQPRSASQRLRSETIEERKVRALDRDLLTDTIYDCDGDDEHA